MPPIFEELACHLAFFFKLPLRYLWDFFFSFLFDVFQRVTCRDSYDLSFCRACVFMVIFLFYFAGEPAARV